MTLGEQVGWGHVESDVSASVANEGNGQVHVSGKGHLPVDDGGPTDGSDPIVSVTPRFGIAGWTGPVYDASGNLVGRVDEDEIGWVHLAEPTEDGGASDA
jgi:hypothetical protein